MATKLTAEFGDANHATFQRTDAPERPPVTVYADRNCDRHHRLDLLQGIRIDGQACVPIREGVLSLDVALGANHSAELGAEVRLDG